MTIALRRLKRNPKLIRIGLVLFSIGIVGLILPFISFRTSDDYVLLDALAKQRTDNMPAQQFVNPQDGAPIATPDPNLPNISNRLTIPQIGVDMPLFAGDSAALLLKGGWLFPGTAAPGQPGNTVIFGHRFRYMPPISNTFFALDKIKTGDIFKLTWNGKVYIYTVIASKIIEPTDFSVLEQNTITETITLITCAPLFSTAQRLVVTAVLLK